MITFIKNWIIVFWRNCLPPLTVFPKTKSQLNSLLFSWFYSQSRSSYKAPFLNTHRLGFGYTDNDLKLMH